MKISPSVYLLVRICDAAWTGELQSKRSAGIHPTGSLQPQGQDPKKPTRI